MMIDLNALIKRLKPNGKATGDEAVAREKEKPSEGVHHPYLDGRYHLDRALRQIADDRDRWRSLARLLGALLAVSLIAHAGFVFIMRPKVYVAQVDQLGAVRVLEPVAKNKLPTDLQALLLQQVLQSLRTVPDDEVLLREHIRQALSYLTGKAATTYQEEARRALEAFQKEGYRRYVERIVSITQADGESWRVLWYETEVRGAVRTRYAREGVFHVVQAQPPEELMLRNPLGFFVTAYSITTLNQR